jgi:hypothetical protein
MKKTILSLAALFVCGTASAFTVDSTYPSGTDATKAYSKCKEISTDEQSGATISECPVMPEAKAEGYQIGVYTGEHAQIFWLKYNGYEIEFTDNNIAAADGTVYKYKLPTSFEDDWMTAGVENAVFEFRYKNQVLKSKNKKVTVRVPYAIIYRDNFTVFAADTNKPDQATETPSEVRSGLVVVKLEGMNTEVIGVIDSIKAYNDKVKGGANALARACADSIVGKGNAAACTNN